MTAKSSYDMTDIAQKSIYLPFANMPDNTKIKLVEWLVVLLAVSSLFAIFFLLLFVLVDSNITTSFLAPGK